MRRIVLAIFLLATGVAGQTKTASVIGLTRYSPVAATTDASVRTNLPSSFELLRTRYRFENDGTGRKEVTARIRILNELGAHQRSEVTFDYQPSSESLEIPYVRVAKKDGSIVKIVSGAVIERAETPPNSKIPEVDYDEKRIPVPGLSPGDVLEYEEVTVIRHPLAPGQFWAQYNFQPSGVREEQLEVDIPRSRVVKVKSISGIPYSETEDSRRRVYHWRYQSPDAGRVLLIPYLPGRTPDVQVSSFQSWQQVGRWYAALEKNHREPTLEVKAKADELTKGLSSDIERVESLYNFAAKNIRYVSLSSLGIGGYEPHSAEETIHSGHGDCKDKTTLLRALLEAEGLRGSSVLISADRKLDLGVPSPWYFDHVIAVLHIGKADIWMDPSSAVLPFRMLAYPLRAKQALVVPTDGPAHLVKTPVDASVPNIWFEEIAGAVGQDGSLNATVRITARGDSELPLRQDFVGQAESAWPVIVQAIVRGIDRKADKISDVKVSDPAGTSQPFTLSFQMERPRFATRSSGYCQLTLPLSDSRLPSAESETATEWHRPGTKPFQLGPPREYIYSVKLEVGRSQNNSIPPPVILTRPYAVYKVGYRLDEGMLVAERRLVTRADALPASVAKDYSDFREEVLADEAKAIVLQTTPTAASTEEME
jgi:Domain of Unknown Function with PDB structure (DUF3857)/Transglutaminase-like superfamily